MARRNAYQFNRIVIYGCVGWLSWLPKEGSCLVYHGDRRQKSLIFLRCFGDGFTRFKVDKMKSSKAAILKKNRHPAWIIE